MPASNNNNKLNPSLKRSAAKSIHNTNTTHRPSKRPRSTTNTTSNTATKSKNISKYLTNPLSTTSTKNLPSPSLSNPMSPPQQSTRPTTSPPISLTYHTGSLFAAPPATLLIHACNSEGSWGGGIALAFRKSYPLAFQVYASHCAEFKDNLDELVGSALLIPPQGKGVEGDKGHWIGCVFTSVYKGKRKDGPGRILESTKASMEDLVGRVEALEGRGEEERQGVSEDGSMEAVRKGDDGADEDESTIAETKARFTAKSPFAAVRMCKINSGLFNVEWERTVEVLEGLEVPDGHPFREIEVWEREE